jgi:hypothetical protein
MGIQHVHHSNQDLELKINFRVTLRELFSDHFEYLTDEHFDACEAIVLILRL